MPNPTISKLLIILSFTVVLTSFGVGVWAKEISPLVPFVPDFSLIKTGIFSKNGSLRRLHESAELKELCKKGVLGAWITHRLSKGEVLFPPAGDRLGREVRGYLEGTCIKSVELDVEPMPEAYDWMMAFAAEMKKNLGGIELRFTIPAEFSKGSLEKFLPGIDGVDWMLYDTGLSESEKYVEYLLGIFGQVDAIPMRNSQRIVLGLPAYYDKTKLHKSKVENLKSVLLALSKYKPQDKTRWCDGRVVFALYAAWTLTAEDKAHTQLIRAWRETLCKKDS